MSSSVFPSFRSCTHGFSDSIKASVKPPDFVPPAELNVRPIVFTVANGLFAQQGFPFEPAYLNLLRGFYHAPLVPTDFKGNPDRAVGQINAWLSQATHGQIPGAIARGAFTPLTRMVLTNELYFQAHWFIEFDPKKTKPAPFNVRGGAAKYAQTMQVKGGFGYQEGDGFSAISVFYAGEEFQLLILLPKSPDGLPALEQRLTADDLTKFAKLKRELIRLHLPRFHFNSGAGSLAAKLRVLGLKTVFDDPPGSANFRKIAAPSPDGALELTDVLHETTLTVNEEGTIAAAITEGGPTMFGAPAELWINRPFFFAVQHIPTGACILLGHVVDPRENPGR